MNAWLVLVCMVLTVSTQKDHTCVNVYQDGLELNVMLVCITNSSNLLEISHKISDFASDNSFIDRTNV